MWSGELRFVVLVATICVLLEGSSGLRDVSISSGAYVRRGEDVNLICDYKLENETLYAVKWYWNNQEFYRFVPKEVPPQQVFHQSQVIPIDGKASNDHAVVLQKVPFEASGKFTCVVSVEGTFKTLSASQNVTVVAVDRLSPVLHLDQDSYHVGELGRVSCSKNGTAPPANVTWFVNEVEVNKSQPLTLVTKDKANSRLSSVLSTLYFPITDFLPIKVKCRAELYDIFSETSSTVIQPKPRIVPVAANTISSDIITNHNNSRSNQTKYYEGLFANSRGDASAGARIHSSNSLFNLLLVLLLPELYYAGER